jgi:hypothetical protein
VTTQTPHGFIKGQTLKISGTSNFNASTWVVDQVSSDTVITMVRNLAGIALETVGQIESLIPIETSTLVLDPSYKFKFDHDVSEDITVLSSDKAYIPSPDGTDYGCYLTGTVDGRLYAQQLIDDITAFGINLEIIVVYPYGIGFGNGLDDVSGFKVNDVVWIWGQ